MADNDMVMKNVLRECAGAMVQDTEVLPLIKDCGAVWTFGANTMNIDYEVR